MSAPEIAQLNQQIANLNQNMEQLLVNNEALNQSYLESLNEKLQQKAIIIGTNKELKATQDALKVAQDKIIEMQEKLDGDKKPKK